MSRTRLARLAKKLGPVELARRLGSEERDVKRWAKKLPKVLAKDPTWHETLRTIEKRHLAAKKARAAQKLLKPKFWPLEKPAKKKTIHEGRDQRDAIKESLAFAKKAFPGSKLRTRVYKSGQVRAELRVPVPKHRTVRDVLLHLGEEATFKPGVWVSTGFTFRASADRRDEYKLKNKGLERVNTSPQKKQKFAQNLITGIQIGTNIQKRHEKPSEVILRAAWNPSGKQESFRRIGRKKRPR